MKIDIHPRLIHICSTMAVSLVCLFAASAAHAEKPVNGTDYIESPIVPKLRNLSEPQPYEHPVFPTNIMNPANPAYGGDRKTIRQNKALSYSFSVEPGSAFLDFSVVLNWTSDYADLDIDFGRWDTDLGFVSLQQSIKNIGKVENIYIPRLIPGTYSIIVKSDIANGESVKNKAVSINSLLNNITHKRKTRFAINWSAENRPIKLLHVRAKLEGPYDDETGLMNDSLRTLGLIPAMEPYFLMGWGGDGEIIDLSDPNGILSVTGNDAIVDWIKVQIYDYTFDGYEYLDSRSALLQRDGDIIDINGGPVQFLNIPPGDEPYYVAIQHRNHTTILTELPHPIGDDEPLLDFTQSSTEIFEDSRNPSRRMINDELVIYSGDIIRNGTIDEADVTAATDALNQTGYIFEDVNLDGACDVTDTNIISNNLGKWDWG